MDSNRLLEFRRRWERLVRFVRSDAVVPLVGAGVSQTARSELHPEFNPSASALTARLREGLIDEHLLGRGRSRLDPNSKEARSVGSLMQSC